MAGDSALYPTVMLDLDGNERASIGLRSNTLAKLHVLLDQLTHKRLPGALRSAALTAFFAVRDAAQPAWRRDLDELSQELRALQERIQEEQKLVLAQPKKLSSAQRAAGLDKDARRQASRVETWRAEARGYGEYASAIRRLLELQPSDFDPGKFKLESLIPPKSLGPPNTLADLQNYVVGPAAGGLALAADGSLDFERSFRRIDYFAALESLAMRNNVQAEVAARPVDFTAVHVPTQEDGADGGIWLRRSASRQALILTRHAGGRAPSPAASPLAGSDATGGSRADQGVRPPGALEIRYLPVAGLIADPDGALHFDRAAWTAGFPLELFEDPQLAISPERRAEWLSQWHTEREWFEAVHRTRYSNGIIGLTEELIDLEGAAEDHYTERKRRLRRADLLVFANDHWNFNARGFNPGGNHGSLLRASTRSVFMIAGGQDTGLPRGAHIATPYDSLSFVPTILKLMGRPEAKLPGPVIEELAPR